MRLRNLPELSQICKLGLDLAPRPYGPLVVSQVRAKCNLSPVSRQTRALLIFTPNYARANVGCETINRRLLLLLLRLIVVVVTSSRCACEMK